MDICIEVPLYLLEDIFRLLEYLNALADRDSLYSQKNGCTSHFEHDCALWELKLKIKRLQSPIVETYLLTFGDITEDEKRDLREWVAAGNSVYDNPCHYCDEKGSPMDYISAMRVLDEQLAENALLQAYSSDDGQSYNKIMELPF